jgi:hypothetical protein
VSEFYQPLDALRNWFVAPSARIEVRDLPIYVNNEEVADFRDREAEADLDFGRNIGNWGEIRFGVHRINGATRERDGYNPADADLVEQQYNEGEFFSKFSYDQLDNVHFPREGQTFTIQWDADRTDLGSDFKRDRLTADWLVAESRGAIRSCGGRRPARLSMGISSPLRCRSSIRWADSSIYRALRKGR